MRNREQDEQWIRDTVKQAGVDEVVYIAPNHYDGGYEVRLGVMDVFVDYGAIDARETAWLNKMSARLVKGESDMTAPPSLPILRLRSGQVTGEEGQM